MLSFTAAACEVFHPERRPFDEAFCGRRVLLSNRAGRIFAVVYLVALHVFLFFLVYYIMVAPSAGHIAVAV